MKSNQIKRFMVSTAIIVMFMLSLTMMASAQGDESDEDNPGDYLIPIPVVVTSEPAPEPQGFTPDGNLSLIDDFYTVTDIETVDEKQFITVETKNGNFFYIVIDRAGDTDNVYFLNKVDELDLYSLLDEGAESYVPEPSPEPIIIAPPMEVEPVIEPEPEGSGNNGVYGIIAFLAVAGIGAAVYFKVIRPKTAVKGNSGSSYGYNEIMDGDDEDEEAEVIGNTDDVS